MTYFVMSAMLAPIGILSAPMSEYFGQPVTAVTAQFTWLTGGILVGAVIALGIFDVVRLKPLFVGVYGAVAAVLFASRVRTAKPVAATMTPGTSDNTTSGPSPYPNRTQHPNT